MKNKKIEIKSVMKDLELKERPRNLCY